MDEDKEINFFNDSEVKFNAPFYIISTKKYWILSLLTIGFFNMVWFYMQWLRQNQARQPYASPFWRTVFNIFFYHSLVNRIKSQTEVEEIRIKWQGKLLATLCVFMTIITSITDSISSHANDAGDAVNNIEIISWCSFIILIFLNWKIQCAINIGYGDKNGESNDKLTRRNWAWIAGGWFVILSISVILVQITG